MILKSLVLFAPLFLMAFPVEVSASESFREVRDRTGNGALLRRETTIDDFAAMQAFEILVPASIKIFVTTKKIKPAAKDYLAAAAYAQKLRLEYPKTHFEILQSESRLQDIRNQFDYVVILDSNSDSSVYDVDVPIYQTQSTGVKCTSSWDRSVNCIETGKKRVQVGSNTSKSGSLTERIIIELFPASTINRTVAMPARNGSPDPSAAYSIITGSTKLSHTWVSLTYGQFGYCENSANAMEKLSGLIAREIRIARPVVNKMEANPDLLGCNE